MLYKLGALVSRVPGKSPVYYANSLVARHLAKYLEQKSYDAIVMPHLYPAEMISYIKRKGWNCPKSVYVATDYTCIPFTGETECDYYVIPHEELEKELRSKRSGHLASRWMRHFALREQNRKRESSLG